MYQTKLVDLCVNRIAIKSNKYRYVIATRIHTNFALQLMKSNLLVIIFYIPILTYSQAVIEGKWTGEYGASTISKFSKSSAINLRYISPKFRWSDDDLTEEQEKQPEKYNKHRIMFEMIYTPPINNLCMGVNVQYRLLRYKIVSLEGYGGIKFFFVRGSDFAIMRPFVEGSSKGIWYLNAGLILQLNLGMLSPFADIGYDGIFTIGTELNLRKIYRKPKGRYKLRTVKKAPIT